MEQGSGYSFIYDPSKFPELTRREGEVLAHLVNGASNKDAARALGISPRTVEVHRARIMEKLRMKNITDATRLALARSMGLVPVPMFQPEAEGLQRDVMNEVISEMETLFRVAFDNARHKLQLN